MFALGRGERPSPDASCHSCHIAGFDYFELLRTMEGFYGMRVERAIAGPRPGLKKSWIGCVVAPTWSQPGKFSTTGQLQKKAVSVSGGYGAQRVSQE